MTIRLVTLIFSSIVSAWRLHEWSLLFSGFILQRPISRLPIESQVQVVKLAFSMRWIWPWPNDFDTQTLRIYAQDVPPHQKLSFYVNTHTHRHNENTASTAHAGGKNLNENVLNLIFGRINWQITASMSCLSTFLKNKKIKEKLQEELNDLWCFSQPQPELTNLFSICQHLNWFWNVLRTFSSQFQVLGVKSKLLSKIWHIRHIRQIHFEKNYTEILDDIFCLW